MKITNRDNAWICRIGVLGLYFDTIPMAEERAKYYWLVVMHSLPNASVVMFNVYDLPTLAAGTHEVIKPLGELLNEKE